MRPPPSRCRSRCCTAVDLDSQCLPEPCDDRDNPLELLALVDGLRPRARGFATDVEDVSPLLCELDAVVDGGLLIQEQAAVGERVGGHVDDPHETVGHDRGLFQDPLLTVV